MSTKFNKLFSRNTFFSGDAELAEQVMYIRVTDQDGAEVAYFDSMLVHTVNNVDSERLQFVQSSSTFPKLYTFGRALYLLQIQCALIDGDDFENVSPEQSRRAYEAFEWLYENVLRAAKAVRMGYRITVVHKGQEYTGFFTARTTGFAAEADYINLITLDFLVLSATSLDVGGGADLPDPVVIPMLRPVSAETFLRTGQRILSDEDFVPPLRRTGTQ